MHILIEVVQYLRELIGMALSDAQQRANKKYRGKFEYLQARVPAEEKEAICNHVEARGESLNNFMRRAFAETIERDKEKK